MSLLYPYSITNLDGGKGEKVQHFFTQFRVSNIYLRLIASPGSQLASHPKYHNLAGSPE